MGPESLRPTRWVVNICERDDGFYIVKPREIDSTSDDEIDRFIVTQIERFGEMIEDRKRPVSRYNERGRLKKLTNYRREIKVRGEEMNRFTVYKEILEGKVKQPFVLVRERLTNEIVGFNFVGPNGCKPNS